MQWAILESDGRIASVPTEAARARSGVAKAPALDRYPLGWRPAARAMLHCAFAPASNQRPSSARSASVICVALFSGMVFCSTAC